MTGMFPPKGISAFRSTVKQAINREGTFAKPASMPAPASEVRAETTATPAQTAKEEDLKIRRGRKKRKTLLTGPLGLMEPASVKRKTLLGD